MILSRRRRINQTAFLNALIPKQLFVAPSHDQNPFRSIGLIGACRIVAGRLNKIRWIGPANGFGEMRDRSD
jgi:hypothetical protein